MSTVVGRLAPSPTGLLHLGHACSFLMAWWSARSQGGRLLLRMEDLDGERCRPEFAAAILRDLEWLGLDWDGPVQLQSECAEAHAAALDSLRAAGLCYPCVCTRREIREAASAPQAAAPRKHAEDVSQVYPGTCRRRFPGEAAALQAYGREAYGREAAWRLRVPPGSITFEDGLYGPQAFAPAAEVGDFPIARRGGAAAYQLAVVVDDAAAGVTEVLRGRDLLPSTARQILLQQHLGLPSPSWTHLPLVLDEAGQRLAKRSGALSLKALREAGTDPRAIVSWVARVAGSAAPPAAPLLPALLRPEELLPVFTALRPRPRDVPAPRQF